MGFFSWITQDTRRSIYNKFTGKKPFKVIMTDNKGNQWVEEDYEGYGVFGGKDYYELVAEMNGITEGTTKEKRSKGIEIQFGVRGIQTHDGKIYLGGGKDFFRWDEPIIDGKSPNELIDNGECQQIVLNYHNPIFPSLTESGEYIDGIAPEDCPDQGYFL